MEWLLWWVFVVGFAVALFVPYRWADDEDGLERDESDTASPEGTGPPLLAHGIAVYAHEDGTVPSSEPGRCRDCGTDNDPDYTYCRTCLARL